MITEKTASNDSDASSKTVKAKCLRVVFAALLFIGIVMYTCCSMPHPGSLTRNPFHRETSQSTQTGVGCKEQMESMSSTGTEVLRNQPEAHNPHSEKPQHQKEPPTTTIDLIKRKDFSQSDSDSSETSDSKSTPIYDKPWMRFLFALGGIIVLNMVAICIHHLYLIVTRSQNRYREFEEEKSPF
ncbi:hypothetical protein I9W82_002404 [Candida metapsilosis]|uniref:Uncharacterized protein n=1 Tax=Candida metapsilosis TaxID=273372 RepID=A0A8H7ZET8_9ASCO|nr:hypothetical protein I9W82_002404 [Candida metapsilosis]